MALPANVLSAIQAFQAALVTAQTAAPNGSIANLSIAELAPLLAAAQTAYQTALTAQQAADAAIVGFNLDAFLGASTQDGFAEFTAEQNNVGTESDLVTVLGYLGRIVGNLSFAGG